MQQTNLKKLIKQIDRYEMIIITDTGHKTINAADFLRNVILNLAKNKSVKNIKYYTKERK